MTSFSPQHISNQRNPNSSFYSTLGHAYTNYDNHTYLITAITTWQACATSKGDALNIYQGLRSDCFPPGQEVQWPPTTWTTRRPAWPRGAPALRRGAREMNAASSWATSATTSVSVSLALRVCVPSLKDYTNSSLLFKCTRVLSGVESTGKGRLFWVIWAVLYLVLSVLLLFLKHN